MASYPTLREQVRDVLTAAGFKAREDTLPTFSTRGTFDLTSGSAVVRVQVSWWDATPGEKRALLERMAAALERDRFVVEDRGERLHVAEPPNISSDEGDSAHA